MAGTAERLRAATKGPVDRPSTAGALLRLARPRQWAKNVLVFAAPAAAGVLDSATPVAETLVAFAAFCLAASGTYYVNDARDAGADRAHPDKRHRPVAAGIVSPGAAYGIGFFLLVASVGVGAAIRLELAATLLAYIGLTTAYSWALKHTAVLDIVAVASGFVLRAVAGAAAVDVPISDWFFIVISFLSLFMVTGKRGAEVAEMGAEAVTHRPVLAKYSPSFLAYLRSVSSSAVLVAYCLWAFEKADATSAAIPWYQLSILPFVVGVFRYALLLDRGFGSAPEDIVLTDRRLMIIVVVWAALFGAGVYSG